jgi:hypothetical protein
LLNVALKQGKKPSDPSRGGILSMFLPTLSYSKEKPVLLEQQKEIARQVKIFQDCYVICYIYIYACFFYFLFFYFFIFFLIILEADINYKNRT